MVHGVRCFAALAAASAAAKRRLLNLIASKQCALGSTGPVGICAAEIQVSHWAPAPLSCSWLGSSPAATMHAKVSCSKGNYTLF